MKSKRENEFISRDNLLKILNDEEATRVLKNEPANQLADGDEFIDLAEIERGVQRAGELNPTDVLARKALHENTWRKIVTNINAWKKMSQVNARPTKFVPRPSK